MPNKEIQIDGIIGWDVMARDVRDALADAGDVELQIHSPGGSVSEGLAIINTLRAHGRKGHAINARVVGYAASMATGIAMAADTVEVEDNAVWMIHNPLGVEIGDYRAMRKYGDILDSLARVLAKGYAEKTGRTINAIRTEMDDETWLFGDEIVSAGFADSVVPAGDGAEARDDALAMTRAAFDNMRNKLREEQTPVDQIAALLPHNPGEEPMSQDKQAPAADIKTEPPTEPNAVSDTPSEPSPDAIAEAIAAERKRVSDVTARCNQVGMPHLAQALVDSGADIAATNAAIVDEYVKRGGAEIRQVTNAAPDDQPATPININAIYAARRQA
jgi:ATP-dependent protease ClpP protease subunit